MPPASPSSPRPPVEVADVIRGEADTFLRTHGPHLSAAQRRVLSDVQACRTAVMGGHVRACSHCDHREIAYNSCRNRHCPKCQAQARAQWLAQREAELLPIPYFHLVFTLPAELAELALQNKRLLYGLLFRAASETLMELAANPRHLGAAQIGILAVLHTWGQNLMHHPHLHCVVSGGGLAEDDARWIPCCDYFFLPVKLLSHVYRQKFCHLLEVAFQRGELEFHGKLAGLSEAAAFQQFVKAARQRKWVVYAKRPFREPASVLKYLARYTHRVAISNQRLLDYRAGKVTFRYKDYARGGLQQRTMTLAAHEFLRRFLLHVLPDGFMRIRHYGLLANRHRREKLDTCRRLLGCETSASPANDDNQIQDQAADDCSDGPSSLRCPTCQTGRLQIIEHFPRLPRSSRLRSLPPRHPVPHQDSS